jgi:hypothetical protein
MSKRSRRAKDGKRGGQGPTSARGRASVPPASERASAPPSDEVVDSERPSSDGAVSAKKSDEGTAASNEAETSAPTSTSTSASTSTAASTSTSPEPASAPASAPANDDDPNLGVSDTQQRRKIEDAFFAGADERSDSVPPSSFDDAEEDDRPPPLSPEILARRARLRKVVAGIVAVAGVAAILVGARHLMTASQPPKSAGVSVTAAGHQQVVPSIDNVPAVEHVEHVEHVEPAKAAVAAVEPAPAASASAAPAAAPATSAAEAQPAEPPTAASAEPAPSASAAAPGAAVDADELKKMKKEARSLIERGRLKEGIPAAQAAIDADPTDAELYLLLGAALQDTGHWKDSIAVFSRCVHEATHGPKSECRALGGH